MKRLIIIAVLFLLANMAARAQNLVKLDDILLQIEKQNPQLKMSDAAIRSMDEAAKGARSWMPPQFETGFYQVPYNASLWKKGANGETGMGQYMVSAEQMFPNKKRQNAESEYMSAESGVEKEVKNANLNQLYAQAKKNYYEWQIIKKKVNVLDQNEKLLAFMIQSTEIRYKNGLGKLSAYYKTKASLGNIQSMQIALENEMEQKRIALNTLMNRDKLQSFEIDTLYAIKDFSSIALDSVSLVSSKSTIKAVEREIQLIILKQSVEKSKLKPEFGLRYDHMFGFGGAPMEYTFMGIVKIPVFWSTRAEKANIVSLNWKAEALNQQKQMLINETSGMAYGLQNEISFKKKQIKLYETNIIPALRKNYRITQIGYEQNTEELFMLYDAWETLNMTQLEYLEQIRQLLLMQVELEMVIERKN